MKLEGPSSSLANKLKVFCRMRTPANEYPCKQYTINQSTSTIELENKTIYSFNKIFVDSSQQEIYENLLLPSLNEALIHKKPSLVFCYGITNSGKTFTVIGDEENRENHGFLPRIMEYLTRIRREIKSQQHKITSQWEEFLEISNNSEKFALFDMKIVLESFEIYNEDIMDLTVDLPRDKFGVVLVRPKLHLKEINRKIFIKDIKQHEIEDFASFQGLLWRILRNRSQNETLLNQTSSRSHCLFKINVQLFYKSAFSALEYAIPLMVVDLAGSERAKRIENFGQSPLMTETCNINKSLLVLGRCLKSLAFNSSAANNTNNPNNPGNTNNFPNNTACSPFKTQIIPYRDSKLTRIIFEYFMDNSNISMIVNINASATDFEETIRVLDYAALAKQIQPIKSTINSLKFGLVSEKASKLLRENEQEQEKKIQRLEEIISNLNDQILINSLMSKYNNILEAFDKTNEKIFELQRRDLKRFQSFDETFSVKIFAKSLKSDVELSFLEEKEDFQSFLAQNPDNCLKKAEIFQKDVSLNTSPCLFTNKKAISFEEKQTSPINFSENPGKPGKPSENPQKNSVLQENDEDFRKNSFETSGIFTKTESFYETLGGFKKKMPRKRNNCKGKDKENDCLAINSKKKKPRKPRKNAQNSRIHEESVDNFGEDEDSTLEKNLENYTYATKDAFCRETPILKRLRPAHKTAIPFKNTEKTTRNRMHFSFIDKSLQAKLNLLKNPLPKPSQSSVNFFSSAEKRGFYVPPQQFASSGEKFCRSFEKTRDKITKFPANPFESSTKRPQSSHQRAQSPLLEALESDIAKLKRENAVVSRKLDRFLKEKAANRASSSDSKKPQSITFIHNQQNQVSARLLVEDNQRLEKNNRRLLEKLEERKRDLQRTFALLQEKEREIKEFREISALNLGQKEIFKELEEKFAWKCGVLEEECREKEGKIEELKEILKENAEKSAGFLQENARVLEENKKLQEKLLGQRQLLKRKDQEIQRITQENEEKLREIEEKRRENEEKSRENEEKRRENEEKRRENEEKRREIEEKLKENSAKDEEKFRSLYAELLNLKLEKKSLLANNLKLKDEKKSKEREFSLVLRAEKEKVQAKAEENMRLLKRIEEISKETLEIQEKTQEIKDFQEKHKENEEEIAEKTRLLLEKQQENAELSRKIQEFQRELEGKREETRQNQENLSKYQEQNERLRREIQQNRQELAISKDELAKVEQKEKVKRQILLKTSEKCEKCEEFAKKLEEIGDLQGKLANLQEKLKEIQENKRNLESLLENSGNRNKKLEEQAQELENRCKTLENTVFLLETQVSKTNGELIEKTQEITEKIKEIDALNSKISQKNEEISKKINELSQRDSEISEKNGEISKKTHELSQRDSEISKKTHELLQRDLEISKKNSEISQKNSEISEKSLKLSEYYQEIQAKTAALHECSQKLERTLIEKLDLSSKISEIQDNFTRELHGFSNEKCQFLQKILDLEQKNEKLSDSNTKILRENTIITQKLHDICLESSANSEKLAEISQQLRESQRKLQETEENFSKERANLLEKLRNFENSPSSTEIPSKPLQNLPNLPAKAPQISESPKKSLEISVSAPTLSPFSLQKFTTMPKLDSELDANRYIEELNALKNEKIALFIENSRLKESLESKAKRLDDFQQKLAVSEREKEQLIAKLLAEKQEMIRKVQEDQEKLAEMQEKLRIEVEQKYLESTRNPNNAIRTNTDRENNREILTYECEVLESTHRSNPKDDTKRNPKKDLNIALANERKIQRFDTNDEKINYSSGIFEAMGVNKRVKSKEFLQNQRVFGEMRQSLDMGLEKRMVFRLRQARLLVKIYENLFNDILNEEIRGESYEELFKELDQRSIDHVKGILKKMTAFVSNIREKEKNLRENANKISILSINDEWEMKGNSLQFINEPSPIINKAMFSENKSAIEQILDENKELRLINVQLEAQVQSLQGEISENDANEEKFLQQVNILKQEVKRLELLLKENDSMFHEKEHIKTNFIKFLETAGAKKFIESEEYLKVLFSMLSVNEMEKDILIQTLSGKSSIDKKKGLISILFKK